MSPSFALMLSALLFAADPAEPRPFHEIDRQLSAALRSESTAASLDDRAAAVRELADLFTELDRDPRLLTSPHLQQHRARARGRLVSVRADLLRDIARAAKASKKRPQMAPLVAAAADSDQHELAAQLAAEASLASYSLGGAGVVFQAASHDQGKHGGGAVQDNGEELVDLITRTIYPDAWKVNGGECTIMYYRPLMCLVVTATGDKHRGVDGLLDGLRRQ
jgi:hypothetical protein